MARVGSPAFRRKRHAGPPEGGTTNNRTFFRGLTFAVWIIGAHACAGHAAEITPRMLLLDGARAGAEIVVVGERGAILRSPSGTGTWQPVASPTRATLTGISFAPASQHGWAVGHDALILATADGGHTWRKQFQGENLEDSFLDVLALDSQHAIAVGAYGLFATTSNGGTTWSPRKLNDDDYHFNRISVGPTGTLYLAGEHGTLLRSIDRGVKWVSIAAPYEGSFYGVLPLDERMLLAYGLRGHVFRSSDDGATWQPVPVPRPVSFATAAVLRDGVIVLAGQARGMMLSRDSGQSFLPFPNAPTTAIAELISLSGGSLLALGEAGASVLEAPR